MTTYYVGPGGNDGNNGTSWATRKLTLNGAEDIPVAAGDMVYVGPGVYRETLTVDVSGSSGNLITYIGDVTGEHTDGIGGVVRITGSDNDTSVTRTNGITLYSKEYRRFENLYIGEVSGAAIIADASTNNQYVGIITQSKSDYVFDFYGGPNGNIFDSCWFYGCPDVIQPNAGIQLYNATDIVGNNTITNCVFIGCGHGVRISNIGAVTITNCTFISCNYGVRNVLSPAAGQYMYVYNSIFAFCNLGVFSAGSGPLVENYNTFYCRTDRTNVSTGANSNAYPPIFDVDIFTKAIKFPHNFLSLSKWSQISNIAGTGEATDDIFGITRPTTSAKKSWGAIQYIPTTRTTGVKYAGSASLKLPDAGAHQMFVPSANTTTSVSVQCYIEGNYNGTQPQVIIKQPGQSDRTNTRTGSTSAWVEITDSFTPAATPPYFVVEMRSNNTTSVGSYATYFDSLTVT